MKKLLTLVVAGAATLTVCLNAAATAGGSWRSFGVTNGFTPGTGGSITGWPTNAPATGSALAPTGLGTGMPLDIQYVNTIGINIQGTAVTTNAVATNVIAVGFVTANCSWQPQVTIGTNAYTQGLTNTTYNDWSYYTNWVVFTLPQPATTNAYFNIATNISTPSLAQTANWIGVVAVTNNGFLGATSYVTNFAVGLNTKFLIRPIAP
jgi:hypothetical protein